RRCCRCCCAAAKVPAGGPPRPPVSGSSHHRRRPAEFAVGSPHHWPTAPGYAGVQPAPVRDRFAACGKAHSVASKTMLTIHTHRSTSTDPAERGRTYGEAWREQIAAAVAEYRQYFEDWNLPANSV